jgi:putative transposase
MEQPYRTRAAVVPLDPTPAQAQLLRSHCGASRYAYNRTIDRVKENLDSRSQEREDGLADADPTKLISWSTWSMTPLWNSVKDEVAPWHFDVTMHAFHSGVTNASVALKNFDESRKVASQGLPVGFPKFKNRHSKLAVTFAETKSSTVWFSEDSHHVRLILPARATDPGIARRRDQPNGCTPPSPYDD